MKTQDINHNETTLHFEVPNTWSDVTVQQYSNYLRIPQSGLTYTQRKIAEVVAFTSIDEDEIVNWEIDQLDKITDELDEFLYLPLPNVECKSIMVDGEEFFQKEDFNSYSAAEIISLELIIEDSKGNYMSMIPELLCILLRKKDAEGKLEEYKSSFMSRANKFRKIKYQDVNSLLLFFSDGEKGFEKIMQHYFRKARKEKNKATQINSEK